MRLLIPLLLLALLGPAMAADYQVGERLKPRPAAPALNYREIEWDDLIPKGWDPMAAFKGLNMSRLKDGDPRAIEALEKMKAAWAEAPVEPSLDGKRVKLAGFVVPLERKGDAVLELLLVPYFGACIHTPPPPANQIVHVILKKPAEGLKMMDAFWVSGTLSLQHGDSSLGIYGYRMTGERLDAYGLPKGAK
ncbi:DUF3299 domain-containing protein [Pseudomonas sp.]|uniref:DUF3299 domain-containing protein n=1 Tax=Pseudomonas sp. TaxID=306 RepID=UPI003D145D99